MLVTRTEVNRILITDNTFYGGGQNSYNEDFGKRDPMNMCLLSPSRLVIVAYVELTPATPLQTTTTGKFRARAYFANMSAASPWVMVYETSFARGHFEAWTMSCSPWNDNAYLTFDKQSNFYALPLQWDGALTTSSPINFFNGGGSFYLRGYITFAWLAPNIIAFYRTEESKPLLDYVRVVDLRNPLSKFGQIQVF